MRQAQVLHLRGSKRSVCRAVTTTMNEAKRLALAFNDARKNTKAGYRDGLDRSGILEVEDISLVEFCQLLEFFEAKVYHAV